MPGFELELGGPFTGFNSAVARHLAPAGALTGSSLDWLLDNVEARHYRRGGMSNVGGTSGILECAYSTAPPGGESSLELRAIQGLAFHMRTMDVGAVPAADIPGFLYADERYGGAHYAQFYYPFTPSDTQILKNMVIGQDMDPSTFVYPKDMKIAAGIGGGRFQNRYDRAKMAEGSRRCEEMGNKLIFPSYEGVPSTWNKQRPYGTANNIERVMPAGHVMPMFPSTVSLPATVNGATNLYSEGSWQAGDMFFYAWIFKYRDGSYSKPMDVRAPNGILSSGGASTTRTAGGFGLVILSTAGFTTYDATAAPFNPHYRAIKHAGIPIGGADVVARVGVRSPKVNGTAVAALPDIGDLRVFAVIDDNTTVEYLDEHGDEGALVTDDNIVRYDHIWMPRARYLAAFDQRMVCGFTGPNPCALLVCPRLIGNAAEAQSGVAYVPDDNGVCYYASEGGAGKYKYYVKVSTVDIKLYFWDGVAGNAPTIDTLTFASYATLQEMVDAINVGTFTSIGWAAAIVPGADPRAKCTELEVSLTSTGTYGAYGDKFTAAAVPYDLQRCYGNCWPGILKFKTAYLDTRGVHRRRIYLTGGGPFHAANAGESWYFNSANIKDAPESVGDLIGIAPLLDGAILVFTKGIGILRNVKGGKTGLDEDYRLEIMNSQRGAICPWSVGSGNGFAHYLTAEGLIVNDGRMEYNLSLAVHNPGARATTRGEWETEINQCVAAMANDEPSKAQFHVRAFGGRMVVSYRIRSGIAVTDNFADRSMEYDYSAGVAANAADQVTREDGTAWGWSAPLTRRLSVVAIVKGTDAEHRYGAYDAFQNSTWTGSVPNTPLGRVDEFETGSYDANATVAAQTVVATAASALLTTSHATADFRSIAVGATVAMGAPTGTKTVSSKQQDTAVATTGCTSVGTSLTTSVENGFKDWKVGAVISHANYPALTTVVSKSVVNGVDTVITSAAPTPDLANVTVTALATLTLNGVVDVANAGTATRTFTGREVEPVGFSTTISPDRDARRKLRCRRLTTKYHKDTTGMKVSVARHLDASRTADTGWQVMKLPTVSSAFPFGRTVLKLPQLARLPVSAVELRWSDDGSGTTAPAFWVSKLEGSLLDSKQ